VAVVDTPSTPVRAPVAANVVASAQKLRAKIAELEASAAKAPPTTTTTTTTTTTRSRGANASNADVAFVDSVDWTGKAATKSGLRSFTVVQLRTYCRVAGLSAAGKKADLLANVAAHIAGSE
jgi:hypothetical protein